MKICRNAAMLAVAALLTLAFAPAAMASSTGHLYVNVKQDYTAARQMLAKINKARSSHGLSKLKLDASLTKSAIARAAEVSICVPTTSPHKRPNGKKASSINSRICYECAGESSYSTVDGMFYSWMGSSTHKAGILLSSARSVGIACATVENMGQTQQFWILDFGRSCKKVVKAKGIKSCTKKVEVLNSKVSSKSLKLWGAGRTGSMTVDLGDTAALGVTYRNTFLKWNIPIRAKSLTWKSSNKSVATVSASGEVKTCKAGTATVTAKLKDGTHRSVSIKVKVVNPY